MAVNVVKYGNQTVMDISDSTTTSNNLLSGEVGYSANGNRVVGALTVPDELNDLGDVNITQVVNGQVLKYNSTTQKWENSNESGGSGGLTLLAYGKSTWNDFITAYKANKIVYCRASSNSNPSSGSQTRMAFMAYVNNETTPTQVEFQYYRSVSSHSDSQQGDQVYIYVLKNTGDWSVTVRNAFTKIKAGTNMTGSYSNGTLTLNATGGGGGSTVSVDTYQSSGTNIADITVDGTTYELYAPENGGGGSEVNVYTYQSTGTNIADIEVDGTRYELYAPNSGGESITIYPTPEYATPLVEVGEIKQGYTRYKFKNITPVLPFGESTGYYIDVDNQQTAYNISGPYRQAYIDVSSFSGMTLIVRNTGDYNCYGFCEEKATANCAVSNIVQPARGDCKILIPSNVKYLLYDYTSSRQSSNNCLNFWVDKYFVHPDYNQENEDAIDYIKNKPEISLDACGSNNAYIHRDNAYSMEDVALVGKTINFNQLVSNGDFMNRFTGWTVTTQTATITYYAEQYEGKTGLQIKQNSTSSSLESVDFDIKTSSSYQIIDDSIILFSVELWERGGITASTNIHCYLDYGENVIQYGSSEYVTLKNIETYTEEGYTKVYLICKAKQGYESAQLGLHGDVNLIASYNQALYVSNIQVFNLSDMFGSSIAQEMYRNSILLHNMIQQYLPKSYYGSNSILSEFASVNISERKVCGKNLINKDTLIEGYRYADYNRIDNENPVVDQRYSMTPLIRIKPNTTYYYENRDGSLKYVMFDENKNYVERKICASTSESGKFITSPRDYYCGISILNSVTTPNSYYYLSDFFPASDNENGEEIIYPFDLSVELNGIPYLKNNKVFWIGDIYYSTGKVLRNVAKIDLSTLSWTSTSSDIYGATITPTGYYRSGFISYMCNKYHVISDNISTSSMGNKTLRTGSFNANNYTFSKIFIKDSSFGGDVTSFVASLTNAYFIYKISDRLNVADVIEQCNEFEQIQFTIGGSDDFVDYQVSQSNRTYEVPPGHLNDEYDGQLVGVLLDKIRPCRQFTVNTSSWVANTDSSTSEIYPYIATIITGGYSNTSCPNWKVQKENTPVPTSTSIKQELGYIEEAVFSNSRITLYATATPSFNVTLIVN